MISATHKIIFVCLFAFVSLATPACNDKYSDPVGSIRIGYSALSPDPSPVWLAYETGIFGQNGLEVTEMELISGGTATAEALVAGDIDIGVMSASGVIQADLEGADLVMILSINATLDYDFVVQPGMSTAEELRGKRFGISGPSGSSATALRFVLQEVYGLDPDRDVELVKIGNSEERLAALENYAIQGTVLDADIATRARKSGFIILANLRQMGIPYQDAGIVVRRAYADEHPEVVRAFIESTIEAIAFYKTAENRDVVKDILGRYLSGDAHYLENAYNDMNSNVLQTVPYVNIAGVQMIINQITAGSAVSVDVNDVIDNHYIRDLEEEGWIEKIYK